MNKLKVVPILFLIIILVMQCSHSFGQNVIQLHEKYGSNKDYLVKTGKKVRIFTNNKKTICGRIAEIKDSSIVIRRDSVIIISKRLTDIPVKNIKYLYCRNKNTGKTIGATCFAALAAYAIYGTIYATLAMGGEGLIIGSIFFLPVPCAGTIYFLVHRKKYDTQLMYDLKIVKPQ